LIADKVESVQDHHFKGFKLGRRVGALEEFGLSEERDIALASELFELEPFGTECDRQPDHGFLATYWPWCPSANLERVDLAEGLVRGHLAVNVRLPRV
jgi:hypothetical protein